ncbi:hypothetical protein DPEC_G00215500 [Dallia pectoralis]|uniref:Uncharacterized protein n=1 Tax=Dallia pectoralis TaxID=75939 RepID=A0ACC2G1Y9_DALPE|nr:hypothetical protein DPEC_G00215500 [Dallia pectoralis]
MNLNTTERFNTADTFKQDQIKNGRSNRQFRHCCPSNMTTQTAEMSFSRKKSRNLVELYQLNLEQRIVQGDSDLVCRDEKLLKEVEGLLRESPSQDIQLLLGLDTLQVMEDSLKATPAPPVKGRVGLEGLARAFEVLELAALNLYLCPWRKEYKVVKMFSGMFTHYVKPALSTQQVADLFGLLGYEAPDGRRCDELRLRSPALPVDTLLRLSCAFFAARCECCLLLSARGPQTRGGLWELSLVQERQQGHSLQAALDNTKRRLETVTEKENVPGLSAVEGDVDLYTDHFSEKKDVGFVRDPPGSPVRVGHTNTSPIITQDRNGLATHKEYACVSTLNCQLTRTPSSGSMRNTQINMKRDCTDADLAKSERVDLFSCPEERSASCSPKSPGGSRFCSCINTSPGSCVEHSAPIDNMSTHLRETSDNKESVLTEESSRASPWHQISGDGAASPTRSDDKRQQMDVVQSRDPILFHMCCPTANPDPALACLTCRFFHTSVCKEAELCQRMHKVKNLGACMSACQKLPYILCRYCSAEYCKDCWYREPLDCVCGQPFDQSSSV